MGNVKELLDLTRGINKDEEQLITKAYAFAERAHEGQKRFSGDAYFSHVFETAKILAGLGMNAQIVAAGLLHDALDNTKITEEEVEKEFGSDMLFLIKGVIKLSTLKYSGHERYVENLRKFFVAMVNDLRVVIIKFADRLHNLRTLQFVPEEEKRRRIAIESIEVYAKLAHRLGMAKLRGEIEEAAFPFAYPEEYRLTEEFLKEKKEPLQKSINEIQSDLIVELGKNKVKVIETNQRIKRKYSLWRKLVKRDMDITRVYDIIAIRVVVNSIEECYRVLGIVHSMWSPMVERIKDYITLPKPNGYQSIHTTVITTKGKMVEIQIRTKEMNVEAAYGIAAHFVYKEGADLKTKNEKLKLNWIERLTGLGSKPEASDKFLENLKMDFFNERIFIFTPEGDVIDLPEDSCAIDFAYSIHSAIGDHVSGARINGKMSSILSTLRNGDTVEIIKHKDAHPSSKWLEHVKTNFARKHIRSYLDKHSLLSRLKPFGRS